MSVLMAILVDAIILLYKRCFNIKSSSVYRIILFKLSIINTSYIGGIAVCLSITSYEKNKKLQRSGIVASFFDEIGKKLSQTGQDAVRKTKDIAEVAKLNSYISDEEERVHTYLYEIGKVYYEENQAKPNAAYLDKMEMVKNALVKIEELNNEIRKIKNIQKCSQCGAEINADSMFCSSCGAKVESMTQAKTEQPSAQTRSPEMKTCQVCGQEVKATSAFCPSCGTKI